MLFHYEAPKSGTAKTTWARPSTVSVPEESWGLGDGCFVVVVVVVVSFFFLFFFGLSCLSFSRRQNAFSLEANARDILNKVFLALGM